MAMEIRETKLHLDGEGGVTAARTVINDFGLLAEPWAQVIIEGEPQEKPHPDIFGDDHWPDWQKLVTKAREKLLTPPQADPDGGEDDPRLPRKIGGKWFHSMSANRPAN
jgi:hypothetical protein